MHQIGGLMLLSDSVVRNEGEGYPDSLLYDSGQRGKIGSRIKAPVHDLSLHFGPSTITNRTKGLSYSEQQLEKKLSNGLSFVLQYKCHPKGNLYGFGLIASRYEADITKKIEYQGIGFANRLDYIAPLFSMSTALSERWLLGMSFGKDGSQSVRLHYRFARLPVDRDLSAVGCVRKKSPHTADCCLTVSPLYRPS